MVLLAGSPLVTADTKLTKFLAASGADCPSVVITREMRTILDRLRSSFPHVRTMLMDRATLLAHEAQWVKEGTPHVASLDQLRPPEAELYHDLVEDTLGPSVRLEQERVSYSAIERAINEQRAVRLRKGR